MPYKNGIPLPQRWFQSLRDNNGVSIVWYLAQLEFQQGKCAMCGSASSGRADARFAIDHNHETEQKRGLLCLYCNSALGYLEQRDLAEKARSYLNNFNGAR